MKPTVYYPCHQLLLQARGLKKHLKRLNAPRHWMLDKLGGAFVSTPVVRAFVACLVRRSNRFTVISLRPHPETLCPPASSCVPCVLISPHILLFAYLCVYPLVTLSQMSPQYLSSPLSRPQSPLPALTRSASASPSPSFSATASSTPSPTARSMQSSCSV